MKMQMQQASKKLHANADYYGQIFGGYEGNEADLKNYLALASGTDKLQKVYDEKGTDVALEYLHMEQGANADGDGGLKKQEVIDWLNSSNLSNLQKAYLFHMAGSSWKNCPWD